MNDLAKSSLDFIRIFGITSARNPHLTCAERRDLGGQELIDVPFSK